MKSIFLGFFEVKSILIFRFWTFINVHFWKIKLFYVKRVT
jgi:hypothetical protein